MKRYTYRTDQELNASLNAKGIDACYMVLIEGKPELSASQSHTLMSATMEIKQQNNVFGLCGMVIDTRNGQIVATTASA